MKIQFSYPSAKEGEIPEPLKEYYSKQGEEFVLSVDGVVPTARLNEFRTNNTRLTQEIEELLGSVTGKAAASFRGMTKDDYTKEIAAAIEALKKPVKGDEAIEQEVNRRFAALKTAMETQLATVSSERDEARKAIAKLEINSKAIASARALGLVEGAEADLEYRIGNVFTMKDGKVVALDDSGHPRYGTGGKELTIEEYVKDELVTKAPHLFRASEGMGSEGGAKRNATPQGGQKNPWEKGKENVTQQNILLRQNPALAERFKAEAGVSD